MITLHALKYSRATRVLWLLANLDQPCERIDYDRTEEFRAPQELSGVHPLGKSPVIEDEGQVIAESAAILRYLVAKFGDTSHQPEAGTAAFWRHEALLDYVESSFAGAALPVILPAFRGKEAPEQAREALNKHLSYLSQELSEGPMLFGSQLTLADIQMSYLLALLDRFDLLGGHPKVAAYWRALQQQPGYLAAIEVAGPMAPPE
ncbi:glutathione S-transferase family protein [Cribrihabitans neustonicus]|uniref:glutathione S-transferase family protein n=1 Tax=Cribrihabitans neustonicus TaxID=1429085 RepID=UPI003B5BCC21